MNSVSPACKDLKKQYDDCFNLWFSEFLKGNTDDKMCSPILQVYQDCVKQAMKEHNIDLKEIERNVLSVNKENSKTSDSNNTK